jgi:cation:H+ antiporter
LGGLWIGLILIAAITSMPELVTGIGSATLIEIKGSDLALGDLFGSNMFNLLIIALLDVLCHYTPVLSRARAANIIPAGLGILLIAVAAGGILAGDRIPALGWIGIPSIIIIIIYLIGTRWIYRSERNRADALPASLRYEGLSRKTIYLRFALAAAVIIGAGIWLSFIGSEISDTTGWGATFVGSLFLAICTSLPEVVVATAALRLGAIDMAIAALLGSNMLNMAIIAPVDIFYSQGSVFASISQGHIITALAVVVMSFLIIAALRWKAKRKTFAVVSWYAPILIGLYIFGAYALFQSLWLS